MTIISKYHFQTALRLLTNIKPHLLFLLLVQKQTLVKFKNGTKFYIRSIMDLWVLIETYINKDYQIHGLPVGNGWNIIDIGAGIGDFSILAGQASASNVVYAIEPFGPSYHLLQKNITVNKLKNITTYKIAISNQRKLKVNINPKNVLNNSMSISKKGDFSVVVVSLQRFFTQNKISRCHLLKCDCEGGEFDIFSNFNRFLSNRIDNIIMEYHLFDHGQKDLDKLINTFKKLGYKTKLSANPVHTNIGFLFAYKN